MSRKQSRSSELAQAMTLSASQFPTAIQRINYPVHNGQPNPAHGKYFFVGSVPGNCIDAETGRSKKYDTEELAIDNAIANQATRIQKADCSFVAFQVEAVRQLKVLKHFIPRAQLEYIGTCCRGEEKQFFFAKLAELYLMINAMPHEYQQSKLEENAIIYLHYFTGSQDWWITEKDSDQDGEGQLQGFGQTNIGYDDELGYIDVSELLNHSSVNLDLHFKPRTIAELNKKRSGNTEPEVAIVAPPVVPSVGEVASDVGAEAVHQ